MWAPKGGLADRKSLAPATDFPKNKSLVLKGRDHFNKKDSSFVKIHHQAKLIIFACSWNSIRRELLPFSLDHNLNIPEWLWKQKLEACMGNVPTPFYWYGTSHTAIISTRHFCFSLSECFLAHLLKHHWSLSISLLTHLTSVIMSLDEKQVCCATCHEWRNRLTMSIRKAFVEGFFMQCRESRWCEGVFLAN